LSHGVSLRSALWTPSGTNSRGRRIQASIYRSTGRVRNVDADFHRGLTFGSTGRAGTCARSCRQSADAPITFDVRPLSVTSSRRILCVVISVLFVAAVLLAFVGEVQRIPGALLVLVGALAIIFAQDLAPPQTAHQNSNSWLSSSQSANYQTLGRWNSHCWLCLAVRVKRSCKAHATPKA
jgi:hypothetical protein